MRYAFAVALALGTVETAKALVVAQIRGIDFGLARALVTNMSWWLLWVPLAGIVFWFARRVPFKQGALRWVAVHGTGCVVLALVHIAASAVFVRAGAIPPPGAANTVAIQFRALLAGYLLTDFVTYGVILASYTALVSGDRLRAEQAERARLQIAAVHAEADRARIETLMTQAHLRALRSELDPHFLFNSLNSVAALVQRGDREGAIRMTSRIGDLLRCTLEGRDDPEVTLGQEIDLLRLYLDIESVRFADRLRTCFDVPTELRGALVPSFILQPLVENALRHAVARSRKPVFVEVRASAHGDALRLAVRDTGPGGDLTVAHGYGGTGIGLRNIRERMSALYGDAASLDLRQRPEGGAEAVVTFPLRLPRPVELDG
jgi:signal transduction histidine kinase